MTPLHAVIGMTELALHQPLNPVTQALLSRSLDAAHTLRGALQKLPLAARNPPEPAVPEPVASRKLMQRAVAALPSAPESSQRWLQVDPAWPAGLMVIDQLWRELIAALFASVASRHTQGEAARQGTGTILHLCAPPFNGWTRVAIDHRGDGPHHDPHSGATPQVLDRAAHRLGGRVRPHSSGDGAYGWQVDLPLPAAPSDMLSEAGDAAIAPLTPGLLPLNLALHHAATATPDPDPKVSGSRLAAVHLTSGDERVAQAVQRPLQGFRILVVDDVENNLIVSGGLLEEAGALVEVAHNGAQALDRLRAQIAGERPTIDLVLMDCQMPVLDGLQTTRHIRSDLGLTQLPILALTANSSQTERSSSLAAGMNDHLNKPMSSKSMVRAVLRHLQPVGTTQRSAGSSPITDVGPVDLLRPTSTGWDSRWLPEIDILAQSAGLDLQQIDVLFGNATPLFVRALGKCLEDEPAHQKELMQIRADADHPRLRAWLHARSGVWASLGLFKRQQLAAAAQLACQHRMVDGERQLDDLAQALTDGHAPLAQLHRQLKSQVDQQNPNPSNGLPSEETAPGQPKLEQLLQLLEAWDMDALRVYEQHKDRLMRVLPPTLQQRVDDCLARLRFAEAAGLLRGAKLGSPGDASL